VLAGRLAECLSDGRSNERKQVWQTTSSCVTHGVDWI
jgi:hypothetical protein